MRGVKRLIKGQGEYVSIHACGLKGGSGRIRNNRCGGGCDSDGSISEGEAFNVAERVDAIKTHGHIAHDIRTVSLFCHHIARPGALVDRDVIPGAGIVRAIERRGAEWVVVTSVGLIDSRDY